MWAEEVNTSWLCASLADRRLSGWPPAVTIYRLSAFQSVIGAIRGQRRTKHPSYLLYSFFVFRRPYISALSSVNNHHHPLLRQMAADKTRNVYIDKIH